MLKRYSSLLFALFFIAPVSQAQVRSSIELVLVKGGSFLMGSPGSEPERGLDEVQHRVRVSDFLMARNEVTQKEYRDLMGNNPSEFLGDDLPVENVTWFDAVRYCNALSLRDRLTPAYAFRDDKSGDFTVTWDRSADGYRLPTEAEWEYACRAGSTGPFNTGDTIPMPKRTAITITDTTTHRIESSAGIGGVPQPFEASGRTAGVCSTCTETSPNGAGTGTVNTVRPDEPICRSRCGKFPRKSRRRMERFSQAYPFGYRSPMAPDEGMYSIGIRVVRNR
jgi:hypothetical protein